MPWFITAVALVGLVGSALWWRKKLHQLSEDHRAELEIVKKDHQEEFTQLETRQETILNSMVESHELRPPLSMIKGYVETLIDGARNDPEVAAKFLDTINRNAERLRLLIEDLLTISELESGRVSLRVQTVSLRGIVGNVLEDFKSKATDRRVQLINEVPDTQ